jgi:hypothetical protein
MSEGAILRLSLPIVSVIVPAHNEAGDIRRIFKEIPFPGAGTERIFFEGHAHDKT